MGSIEYFGSATTLPRPGPPPSPVRRPSSPLLAGAGLIAAVAVIAAVFVMRPAPVDRRPVVLPDALAGLPMAEPGLQFSTDDEWQQFMQEDFGERGWGGRAFGGKPGPLAHLTVIRSGTDTAGDLKMARKPYLEFGDVTCTHTFAFGPLPGESKTVTARRDTWLLCWRKSDALTVTVLVLITPPQFEQTAAAAVNDVWARQQ